VTSNPRALSWRSARRVCADLGRARVVVGWGALWCLFGCPQLLGDDFASRGPQQGLDLGDAGLVQTHDDSSLPDASAGSGSGGSAGSAGNGGTGGSAGAAGSGGSTGVTDPAAALRELLLHRYRFEGTGAAAVDAMGAAGDGVLQGTTLSGTGYVALTGGAYVDLPNGMISSLQDATFETWLVWHGGAGILQRIFDFGSSSGGEGAQGSGASYVFLSPSDTTTGPIRGGFTKDGLNGFVWIDGVSVIAIETLTHVAMVVDSQTDLASLYVNGQPDGAVTLTLRLSEINDNNNWLGRPQVSGHAALNGDLHEFRIYGGALAADQIALSYQLGPDPTELE